MLRAGRSTGPLIAPWGAIARRCPDGPAGIGETGPSVIHDGTSVDVVLRPPLIIGHPEYGHDLRVWGRTPRLP
jgi:hypothetical protein